MTDGQSGQTVFSSQPRSRLGGVEPFNEDNFYHFNQILEIDLIRHATVLVYDFF